MFKKFIIAVTIMMVFIAGVAVGAANEGSFWIHEVERKLVEEVHNELHDMPDGYTTLGWYHVDCDCNEDGHYFSITNHIWD